MASPPIFSMALEMPSGPTDLFLPIIANRFLIMPILMVKVLSEWVEIKSAPLAAEDRSTVVVYIICLIDGISDEASITAFDRRNIFRFFYVHLRTCKTPTRIYLHFVILSSIFPVHFFSLSTICWKAFSAPLGSARLIFSYCMLF